MVGSPLTDPLSDALGEVLERLAVVGDGAVADHIPALATADPAAFGIAVGSVHGRTYRAGDWASTFTLQSIAKPFVYALALSEHGLDEVARHVGFEPSGELSTAINLDAESGRPANPLIDAGAIVTCALVPGARPAERFEKIRQHLSAFAARELHVDKDVFTAELATDDRSRALAYLTLSAGILPRSVDDVLEVYFRQCSLLVSAEDLAVMAATLANAGINPLTDEQVVDERVAAVTMSVLAMCGMHASSGEWMARVGLPAVSGLGGGIAAAKPAQFGIGLYSPRLDERGNSTRGVATLQILSREFGLHLLVHPTSPRSPIVTTTNRDGRHVVVLHGELDLISAEEVVNHLVTLEPHGADAVRTVVLDLTRVARLRPEAERLLAATASALADAPLELSAFDPGGVVDGVSTSKGALPTTREVVLTRHP